MPAERVRPRPVVREEVAHPSHREGAGGRRREQLAAPRVPDVRPLGVRRVALVRQHPRADVVVRVREVPAFVEARDLGVGGAPLHVRDAPVGRRQHVVVARGAVRAERRGDHVVERAGADHLEHLVVARDADPLVVRTELVAGE